MTRIATERLVLRPFVAEDAPWVQVEAAREETARMTLTIPHPYPEDGAAAWIATTVPGQNFAMELRDGAAPVGSISLMVEEEHRRAEIGYMAVREHWGRGYTTEAVRALITHGFDERDLNRIYAQCFSDNPASRRVLEKAGMTYEGARRQHVFRLGRVVDTQQFGILRSEWRA